MKRYSAPQDVQNKQGSATVGKIIDEVWADEALNLPPPHPQPCSSGHHCWGDYSFCAQLISWNGKDENDIRLAYYRRR
jgi:hypothetical protein